MLKQVACGTLLLASLLVGTAWADDALNKELFAAVRASDKAKVEAIVAKGANVNARDSNGNTPLVMTVNGRDNAIDYDIASLLIAKGANVNNKGLWMTPLHYAVANDRKDLVELLVAKGADVNAKGWDGTTPLDLVDKITGVKNQQEMKAILLAVPGTSHVDFQKLRAEQDLSAKLSAAAMSGDKARVEAVVAEGADVNGYNGGSTPLHDAAFFGNKEVVELLIAKGADLKAQDQFGAPPLSSAASGGRKEVAELLIAKGAEVNAKDKTGRTPLWFAVSNQKKEMVELLIAKGADVNAKNQSGQTPVQWAGGQNFYGSVDREKINQEIEAILIAASTGNSGRDLPKLLSEFKGNSGNDALRAAIIGLALKQRPAPAIPSEAEAAAGRGAYIFKNAKSTDDTLSAAKEYLAAIEAAPWVANYYYNLCTVLEKTPYTQQSLHACKLYLIAAPNAADAGEMQQRIAGLQYAADRDKAQMKNRTAYIRAGGVDDLYRFGGISGSVSGKDIALKLFVDWGGAPPKYQIYVGCLQSDGVYGETHDLVETDSWIRMCHPGVGMHLLIKPEGEGFVALSDESGSEIRTTLNELFSAKQKTMAQAVLFSAAGDQGDQFYVTYLQGGVDDRHAGYAMYKSDCNGGVLKQDPRALPDDFVPLTVSKTGSYGRFLPEVVLSQPNADTCVHQFASKTGYRFGETE